MLQRYNEPMHKHDSQNFKFQLQNKIFHFNTLILINITTKVTQYKVSKKNYG